MQALIRIVRNYWVLVLATLGIIVGLGMVGYGTLSGHLGRSSLQVVVGTITEATRVTLRSRGTGVTLSYYEMTLRPRLGAAELKLRVSTTEIAESDVRSLLGGHVRAEFDSAQDVYVLSSGTREVLSYANTLERRNLNLRQYYVDGVTLMSVSAVGLVIGLAFAGMRRRRAN